MLILTNIYNLTIRDRANAALWFAETYGLMPKSLTMEEGGSRKQHTINLGKTCTCGEDI